MAARLDISVIQGDTVDFEARLWQDRYKRSAYDASGATVRGDVRTRPDSPVLASFNTTLLNNQTVRFGLSAAQSRQLPAGKHLYDLEVERPDGTVQTVLTGNIVVKADITRGEA